MILQSLTVGLQYIPSIINGVRDLFFVGGGFWGLFKFVNWIKDIKSKDLADIQTSINTGFTSLSAKVDNQTEAIVKHLEGMRSDFQDIRSDFLTLYAAPAMAVAAPKRKPRKSKIALDK